MSESVENSDLVKPTWIVDQVLDAADPLCIRGVQVLKGVDVAEFIRIV